MEQVKAVLNLIANLSVEHLALIIVGFALVVAILSLHIVGKVVVNKFKDEQ